MPWILCHKKRPPLSCQRLISELVVPLAGTHIVKLAICQLNLTDGDGWAYPTSYSSMTNDEVNALLALAKTSRSKKTLVWKFLSKTIGAFDFGLLEPKVGDLSVPATDKGPAIFPKLYRRQTNWSATE